MRREMGRGWVSLDVAVWALPRVVEVLGAAVMAGAVSGVGWLGARALGVVAFVGQALVTLWLGHEGRGAGPADVYPRTGLWAALWAAAGTGLVVTDLSWDGYEGGMLDSPPGVYDAIAHRLEARDLPPIWVYGTAVAGILMTVACLALAVALWRFGRGGNDTPPAAHEWKAAAAVASGGLVVVSLVAGVGLHLRADRGAESDSVSHAVTSPAGRQDDGPGPAQPSAQAWRREMTYQTGTAVPGWDQVISLAGHRTGDVRAFSASDGAELWRYQRQWLEPPTVTVDPDAGRVLLVDDDAAVVLDLADGEEVAIRRLPDLHGCGQMTDDPTGDTLEHEGAVVVGTSAVMRCAGVGDDEDDEDDKRLVVLEVSTGRVLNSTDVPDDMCFHATPTASTPVPVVQWGSGCDLDLLVPDGSGGFDETPIDLPPLAGASPGCGCDVLHVVARDDTIVLALSFRTAAGDEAGEIVAVDTATGELRWRTAVAAWTGDTWLEQQQPVLEAVTEQGVVAVWDRQWRLLSSVDGRELARQPVAGDNPVETQVVSTTDSERIYSYAGASGGARLVVRRVDDLSLIGMVESLPHSAGTDQELIHAPGRLIVYDGGDHVVGFEDGPPLDRPQRRP
jgi:outer membrane protein assembly factor BamB